MKYLALLLLPLAFYGCGGLTLTPDESTVVNETIQQTLPVIGTQYPSWAPWLAIVGLTSERLWKLRKDKLGQ